MEKVIEDIILGDLKVVCHNNSGISIHNIVKDKEAIWVNEKGTIELKNWLNNVKR